MRRTLMTAFGLVALTAVLASCSSKNKDAAPSPEPKATQSSAPSYSSSNSEPLAVEETATVRVTARVKDVNYNAREVTLQDASGHSTTFLVGPRVQRLNEVRVGDEVTTEFTISLRAERRPPTAEESANPISVVYMSQRATSDAAPAGSEAKRTRIVTTVASVDQAKMLVTLKGPMGDTTVIRGRKLENIKKLNIGDTIVITYTNAVALSLDKLGG